MASAVEYVLRLTGLQQAETGLQGVATGAQTTAAALDATDAAAERASGGLEGVAAASRRAQTAQTAEAGAARAAAVAKAEAGRSAAQMAVDLDALDGSTKRTSQGLASIAMQMPDVVAGLASGQSAVTVFLQQGLQVFQQNLSSLLPALAAIGPALAVVGTAAAALGGVYLYLADAVEEADDAMAAAAARATAMQDAQGGLADVLQGLTDDIDLLTGAVTREELAQRKRDAQIKEQFATIRQLTAAERERQALVLASADIELRRAELTGQATDDQRASVDALRKSVAAYDTTLERLAAREQDALARSELLTFGRDNDPRRTGGGRTVRATPAAAADVPPVVVDIAALSREMQSFAVFTGGDLGPLSDALAESAEGFERASRALARARSPEELAQAAERAATASAGIGIAGSALRGNLGGAVTGLGSMLGPSAAALGPIGAAIGVAQGVGATAEAQGVSVADVTTQAVEGAVGALVAVVEGLPDIIAQTIPVLVSALAVELPIALVAALPDVLAAALYTALIGLPKAIAEAIRDAITPGSEGEQTTTAGAIGRIARRGVTGEADAQDVPSLIAGLLLVRGRDRAQATTSRSASTARRAASTRPAPAAAPNPFRAFADAYDGQFAGPFGASPTTPQLRGT